MERTISAERLYTLAEYQNIKFINTLSGIPEDIANNPELVGKLFFQQFLSCDIAYMEYQNMRSKIAKEKIEDVLGYLKEQRESTMKELYEEIKSIRTPSKVELIKE